MAVHLAVIMCLLRVWVGDLVCRMSAGLVVCVQYANLNATSNPYLPSNPNYYSVPATVQNGTPRCCSDMWLLRHVVVVLAVDV